MKTFKEFLTEKDVDDDYRGSHRAPMKNDSSADASNVDSVMPDYYEHPEYYTHMEPRIDRQTHFILKKIRNKPEALVIIYRAVPKNAEISEINPGDWVTPNQLYAKQHCYIISVPCKILSKKVKAKHIFTNGDSPHEFGYDPS